ncbi:erythromycin esterase family protein [Streptomyces sp. NPDC050504]|uniref:erythromycin esterase family protein n=1 Tax=Streptomyces sp. NPDC050504 TaxID=3365618 RepID=UPI0037A8D460
MGESRVDHTADVTDVRIGRRPLIAAAAGLTGAALTPAAARAADGSRGDLPSVVRALEQVAYPLRSTEPGGGFADLRPLGAMLGGATVVGLGEATHGTHEFFTMKERVFRYLVAEHGFTTFALEMSWPSGLRVDAYVQGGPGNARELVRDAFGGSPWEREEFVHLIAWMRDHNRRNPHRRVHFMGCDAAAPRAGDEFFERITGYVREHQPHLLARVSALYAGLRPLDDHLAYLNKPLEERRLLAANARQALTVLRDPRRGAAAGAESFEWVEQHARCVAETAAFLAFDLGDAAVVPTAMRYRDRLMARNVSWWQRHTGHKVLVSAHNSHVAYVSDLPREYPKVQGAFLRDVYGDAYRAIGFTFRQGSFLSSDAAVGGTWRKFGIGPAAPGTTEHTLGQVRHRAYYLDVHRVPAAARTWLAAPHPVTSIGTQYPGPSAEATVSRSYDVLMHLDTVTEAAFLRP